MPQTPMERMKEAQERFEIQARDLKQTVQEIELLFEAVKRDLARQRGELDRAAAGMGREAAQRTKLEAEGLRVEEGIKRRDEAYEKRIAAEQKANAKAETTPFAHVEGMEAPDKLE